jgi:CheY-specific phosphatase CheX
MKADTAKIREHLTSATFETFEKMFFIFLELSQPDPAAQPSCSHAAVISFKGLLSGSMTIRYSREFLTAMICNLLGLSEEEITNQDLEDCAKEGINIVCGNFLARLESEKALDLTIPVFYADAKKLDAGGAKDSVILCFESDSGMLDVRMAVQNES